MLVIGLNADKSYQDTSSITILSYPYLMHTVPLTNTTQPYLFCFGRSLLSDPRDTNRTRQ
jgi:hypothetical protein